MKLFIILALSVLPVLTNAQKRDKFYVGFQVQPEVTFYKSGYYSNAYPPDSSKSSFNIGFNVFGQYNLTDRLFITLGLGYISRTLNTRIIINQASLPPPYTDSFGTVLISTRKNAYRTLQVPISFGYDFLKTKKADLFASLTFIPNFLLNTKYGSGNLYPAFKKNYLQGFSLNPAVGLDYNLSKKIKLSGAIAYSLINTVKEEEYAEKKPVLKHTYLQLGLGAKLKLK